MNFGFEKYSKQLLSNIHHGFWGKNEQLFVKDLAKVVAYKKKCTWYLTFKMVKTAHFSL